MNNFNLYLILSSISSFSTLLGLVPCLIFKNKMNNLIPNMLSFSSAILLGISFFTLIPNCINILLLHYKILYIFFIVLILIILGIIISIFININIKNNTRYNSLYKIGIISIVSILIHNIPEGIISFLSFSNNFKITFNFLVAMIIHNITEGALISFPIFYGSKNIYKAILFTVISALSEFFGTIISIIFLNKYINFYFISVFLTITAGIMINITINEYFPEIKKYKPNYKNYIYFIIGLYLMYVLSRL